ncbi:FUSC family protein [Flavobacterium sp. CYK-4]|uniref:FUSC family protein n=1 Tax=Flavobacterium lotistagni TaxID=2709660 RepID=UPI00140A43CD|nr:FUSC family protein [Flavobacterium lotistagni]NHM05982.1 FUSC family protein [Flavobacterium lotistagni]
MESKNLSELNDQELLQEYKKIKTASITTALFIGFLIGIVVYSVVKHTWGLFTLIPLFIAYKLTQKPQHNLQEVEQLLKERKLK